MNIEVIAIGNEILNGAIVNTNAAEIGQALFKAGYRVCRQSSLPDDPKVLKQALKEALERSQLVITTGGLGSTCDDLTRQIAAELFESDFYYHEEIATDLKRRYGDLLINLADQATIPTKASILKNPVGTASGLVFRSASATLILLPGIPREMRIMLVDQVLPFLRHHFPQTTRCVSKALHLFRLSESSVDPLIRKLQKRYPDIEFGIYPSHGTISIHGNIYSLDEKAAEVMLNTALGEVATQFADHCFDSPSGTIEEAIHQLFIQKQWTLSLAESCTGGRISSKLTKIPGASEYFLGAVVSYSNFLKQHLLGVPEELIRTKGAVSEEVVLAMAAGILSEANSRFSIAISGVAGPSGGTPDKPVGTIWAAIAQKGKPPQAWRFQARGTRDMIIEWSANAVLGQLYHYCRGER